MTTGMTGMLATRALAEGDWLASLLAMETDDILAAAAARLLLFTDPRRLPALGDDREAWNLYLRNWRPGKPHRTTWPSLYAQALAFVTEGATP